MSDPVFYSNFCAAFLDLLGQRSALEGQDLLFLDENGEPTPSVKESMGKSVQKILTFQKDTEHFLLDDDAFSIRSNLDESQQKSYDSIHQQKMKRQRWSDGLVLYTTMNAAAPMNAIYEVMFASASLCLMQLAKRSPIRGGIDISWGAELHNNELYGAVISNSYALESKIAQYPRIVVGDRVAKYMEDAINQSDESKDEDRLNKALAQFCQSMLMRDLDGYLIMDYLGDTMMESIGNSNAQELRDRAYIFVKEQYDYYRQTSRNSKLASRYNWLVSYFEMKGANKA